MTLLASWHPTYAIFHNPYEWGTFELDVARFGRLMSGTLHKPPERLITHPTVADIRRVPQDGWVAIDIETAPESPDKPWTGKDPTRAQLRTVGLGNTRWGLSHKWNGETTLQHEIRKLLADARVCKVLLNGPWFDLRVLKRYGLVVNNWEDARDGRRAVSSTSPLALRYQASIYDDADPWKEGDEDDEKGLVFTTDYEKLKRYNAQDCVETARVWRGIKAEDEWQTPRCQRLYQIHKESSQLAAEMHDTGILVDNTRRWQLARELDALFVERTKKLQRIVGIKDFTINPNKMRALLFARHKNLAKVPRCFELPDPFDEDFYTDTGAISVDQGCLLMLLTDPETPEELRPIIDMYWQAYAARQARSTYIVSNKVSHAIGLDGRLRPGWNSCGTDTGRWSCSEPNVMNLSQKKDEDKGALQGDLPNMRTMYIPAKGCSYVHADHSQLELRVMAFVAQDAELARRLETGDVYSADAIDWFGLPPGFDVKKLKPEARQAAKIIHLGFQYGAGTSALWVQALEQDRFFPFAQCDLLHHAAKRTYWRTVKYWDEEMARVAGTDTQPGEGFSRSRVLDRWRVYPRKPKPTEVNNYPIQSTAADVMTLGLLKAWKLLKRHVPNARIVFQLHDAMDVECRNRDVPLVSRIVQDAMEQDHRLDGKVVNFPVKLAVTDQSWGHTG